MRLLIAGLALAGMLAGTASAEDQPEWRSVTAETGQIGDLEGLRSLAEDFPDSGSVRLRMLQPLLAAGEVEEVLETLQWLKERGYVFSEGAQARIPEMVGVEHAAAARDLLIPQAEVIETSEIIAQVPAEAGLVESVYALSGGDVLVASSVTENSLQAFLPQQGWVSVPMPGASDLSGMVFEPGNSMGWVASANLDGSDDDQELMTGLLGFRSDLSVETFVLAPEGTAISDLSIGADNTVYASDPLGGGIYKKPHEADASLETLVAPGTFRSPQGSAVSADGRRLYVSDYRYGLAMVDLEDGTVSRLVSDIPLILDGIDGLWLRNGELIAVQNGTSPMRISAFTLSDDGSRIVSHRVLEQAHSGWTEPLGGSINGDSLIYVATGQWDRYIKGEPVDGKPAIDTEIRRLPLE